MTQALLGVGGFAALFVIAAVGWIQHSVWRDRRRLRDEGWWVEP